MSEQRPAPHARQLACDQFRAECRFVHAAPIENTGCATRPATGPNLLRLRRLPLQRVQYTEHVTGRSHASAQNSTSVKN